MHPVKARGLSLDARARRRWQLRVTTQHNTTGIESGLIGKLATHPSAIDETDVKED